MIAHPGHLLIAGCGYVGKALARVAIEHDWRVTAWTFSPESASDLMQEGIPATICDLSDPRSVQSSAASMELPTAVVHCASSGRGGADAYQSVYFQGMQNLAGSFPQSHLIFTGSTSVYAQTDGSEVDESSEANPPRETGRWLRKAEDTALAAAGTVVRLAGIYGPGRSVLLKRLLAGEATLDADGSKHINQIHRDDAAGALWHIVSQSLRNEIFNAADSAPLSQMEIYQSLCALLNKPLPASAPPDLNRKRGWTDKRVSNAKLIQTGWHPIFPRFIDWAKKELP